MYLRFKDGKDKALTLSYDDGPVFDKQLIEIMDKYGLKGTFNINTGLYYPENKKREKYDGRMKLSEAKELYINSGHEVAVHALNHPFLEELDYSEVIYEIMEDRKNIERDYKTVARGMAYPFGTYSANIVDILKMCGIEYSRTTKSSHNFKLPENWLLLNPTCHHNDPDLMELAKNFAENKSSWGAPRMFFLWGHSFEFARRDNWNIIEDFARYIGGKNDIWYATNIEIYDYVQAYKSLKTSCDKKIIYNPSAMDVWVYTNNETIKIKSGETFYCK